MHYSHAAVERAMKIQEVRLRNTFGKFDFQSASRTPHRLRNS